MKVKEYSKKISIGVLYIICYAYGMGVMGSVTYFNWQYAKDNGFVKWLFLGQIIPTAKGIVWPYYLFNKTPDTNKEHVISSFEHYSQAVELINKQPSPIFSVEVTSRIIDLQKKALAEANLVNVQKLKNTSEEFAFHYTQHFIKGLELSIVGYESTDIEKAFTGQTLLKQFENWYSESNEQ